MPETIFLNRLSAENSRPSDRRPVLTSASSTTSAIIDDSSTPVAVAMATLKKVSTKMM